MIIIGEKINGSIPSVAKAIAAKDGEFIKELARKQTAAGATFIDVCASVSEDIEVATMKWLIDLVQEVTDLPIAVDQQALLFGRKDAEKAFAQHVSLVHTAGDKRAFQRDVAHVQGGGDKKGAILVRRFEGIHGLPHPACAVYPCQEERARLPEAEALTACVDVA